MLANFLKQLYDDGRLLLSVDPGDVSEDEAQSALIEIDRQVRVEFPEPCPQLDLASALAASLYLYKACHFLANRDLPEEAIQSELAPDSVPAPTTRAAIYSVDLVFRFLPDLEVLARQAAPKDPLVQALHQQGLRWPLSSVGMPLASDAFDLELILSCPGLRRAYGDRIIARKDRTRLSDPVTFQLIREAAGAFPQHLGELAEAPTPKTPSGLSISTS